MINCSSAVSRLWDFIELELDELEKTEMEEHLAFCRRCCGEVEFAEELRGFLKVAAQPSIPAEVAQRLSDYIDSMEGPNDVS